MYSYAAQPKNANPMAETWWQSHTARLSHIRLLASDLDGTLLTAGNIADETATALSNWHCAGGKFAIITGRPVMGLWKLLIEQGCGVRFPVPDALVCEERDIHCYAHNTWHFHIAQDACLAVELKLLPQADALAQQLLANAGKTGIVVRRSTREVENERGYVELQYPDVQSAEAGCQLVEQLLGESAQLLPVRNGRLVALRHPLAQKGPALIRLARQLRMEPAEILAVGDSHNDFTMLNGSYGFLPATVANADPAIVRAVQKAGGLLIPKKAGAGVTLLLNALVSSRSHTTNHALMGGE